MVHFWILQEAKGKDTFINSPSDFWNMSFSLIFSSFLSLTGFEKTIQSHYWRNISLFMDAHQNQQQNLLHRRTGQAAKSTLVPVSFYWASHQHNVSVLLQISHHPPVSAFYVSNRKDGFCLSGSILAKSKFYGKKIRW